MKAFASFLFVLLTTVGANANPICQVLFSARPTMEQVAKALSKLPKGEQEFFFKTEWGDHTQLLEKDYGYDELFNNSVLGPQNFINKEQEMSGGTSAFYFNVFPEGYFRVQQSNVIPLINKQPWLMWNSRTRTYSIEHGNTASVLLAPYIKNGKVKLYRGVGKEGLELAKRIKSGDLRGITNESYGYTDGLFFTPDRERATESWASEGYLEIELRVEDFPAVYSGIEFDYVEVAIPPRPFLKNIDSLIITEK